MDTMKSAVALVLGIALALTTCAYGSGSVSLSGDSTYRLGPAVWMVGDYRVRLTMDSPEAEGCTDWRLGLKYEVFDTGPWVMQRDQAEFRDGAFLATARSLDDRLHIEASIPPACGRWTAEFIPLDG